MKTVEKTIIEMREARIGNYLRSKELNQKMHEINGNLTAFIEDFEKKLPRDLVKMLLNLDELYSEYCSACENEAFYYGFALGQKTKL